jgi:hypothetical protein
MVRVIIDVGSVKRRSSSLAHGFSSAEVRASEEGRNAYLKTMEQLVKPP